MSVAAAAAVAQNPTRNRLPCRLRSISVSGNRLKPVPFAGSPISPARDRRLLHSVPLQRKTRFADASPWHVRAFESGEAADGVPRREVPGQMNLDEILSVAEAFCTVPSIVFAVGSAVGLVLPGASKLLQANPGNALFRWQFVLVVGAVAIGGLIRRRQWERLCRENVTGFDLTERIENVEDDLRSSATIVRVLSRQLEKLGIRFRVTRKTLKEPISETTALAQKNSEATQALAVQEDILEKELGEIQKVLLAMQEQQQKQLELILAIAKAGRILGSKQESASEGVSGRVNPIPKDSKQMGNPNRETQGVNNDRT